MILDLPVRPGLRILVTARPVDFRRYAECAVMQSPRWQCAAGADSKPESVRIILRSTDAVQQCEQFVRCSEAARFEHRR
jgi:2-C-methyl-D-erythritol 4-phosphate cytidylyltransferase